MIDKKDVKKQYKETLPPFGVYQIKNLVNDRILVGSSKNLQGIFNRHIFELQAGSHMNRELQEDFKLHGEENFSFTVLDDIEPKEGPAYDYTRDLAALEDMWLEKLQPYGEEGYNKKNT